MRVFGILQLRGWDAVANELPTLGSFCWVNVPADQIYGGGPQSLLPFAIHDFAIGTALWHSAGRGAVVEGEKALLEVDCHDLVAHGADPSQLAHGSDAISDAVIAGYPVLTTPTGDSANDPAVLCYEIG